ncbi:hypothetical protein B5G20_00205 [Collinsella sp. An7]|uniref:hypothetical protein n=1 Tax=Collinsella sp. An7 TaxID=1965651 RepID=UPI000B368E4F|nr:hypothetical protein [Collinsella sp. An7]OUN48006.1 hypothetical protein B5G20_00205 [Collinsella sp. An7]
MTNREFFEQVLRLTNTKTLDALDAASVIRSFRAGELILRAGLHRPAARGLQPPLADQADGLAAHGNRAAPLVSWRLPELDGVAKDRTIASFLGMTPVTLTRIKRTVRGEQP